MRSSINLILALSVGGFAATISLVSNLVSFILDKRKKQKKIRESLKT
jgi:hypothetical protein